MEKIRKILASFLCAVMLAGMVPGDLFAAEAVDAQAEDHAIYVLAGSDFQYSSNQHAYTAARMKAIMSKIKESHSNFDGFLFAGDYTVSYSSDPDTNEGIDAFMAAAQEIYPELNHTNSVLVQGNHDTMVSSIDATGGHDFDGYSVYVLNEDDYPAWDNSDGNGHTTEDAIKTLAENLELWLDAKIEARDNDPVFIVSHIGLSYTTRTGVKGDALYAKYIFDVLQEAGKELNIIFMFGHNHSSGYDEWLGGEAIYLPVGDQMPVAKLGSMNSWTTETLNFTYMNPGYVGYYDLNGYAGTGHDGKLTMSVFAITDGQITVERFNEDGLYDLKKAGDLTGSYPSKAPGVDEQVWTSPQTIERKVILEKVTQTDKDTGVSVKAAGLTGLIVNKSDEAAPEGYSAYASYEITPVGYTAGNKATVTIPVDPTFDAAKSVILFDRTRESSSVKTIEDGKISFTTDHFGIYEIGQFDSSAWTKIPASEKQWTEQTAFVVGETYILMGTYDDGEIRCAMQNNSSNGISPYTIPMELTATAFADSSDLPDSIKWTALESGLPGYVYLKNVSNGRYLQVKNDNGESDLTLYTSSWNWENGNIGERYYGWALEGQYDCLYAMNKKSGNPYYVRYSDSSGNFKAQTMLQNYEEVQPYCLTGNEEAYVQLLGKASYLLDSDMDEAGIIETVQEGMTGYLAADINAGNLRMMEDSDLTWEVTGDAVSGYTVTVSYMGIELGTASVSVAKMIGYTLSSKDGYVEQYSEDDTVIADADGNAIYVLANYESGTVVQTAELTLAMVSADAQEYGDFAGVAVAFEGTAVNAEFNLHVAKKKVNLALNKTAAADSAEAERFGADKAVDGDCTNTASRWSSAVDSTGGAHWIAVDLGQAETIESVRIFWELRKATAYRIQVSNDGAEWTDAKVINGRPAALEDMILLDEPTEARYVRLYIDSFTAADPDGGITWATVSIFEIEVYAKELSDEEDTTEPEEPDQTPEQPSDSATPSVPAAPAAPSTGDMSNAYILVLFMGLAVLVFAGNRFRVRR